METTPITSEKARSQLETLEAQAMRPDQLAELEAEVEADAGDAEIDTPDENGVTDVRGRGRVRIDVEEASMKTVAQEEATAVRNEIAQTASEMLEAYKSKGAFLGTQKLSGQLGLLPETNAVKFTGTVGVEGAFAYGERIKVTVEAIVSGDNTSAKVKDGELGEPGKVQTATILSAERV